MILKVPDESLGIERKKLAEFLINFARFEYAVMAAGYSSSNRGYAEPDWDNFCGSITTDFWSSPAPYLIRHLEYIRSRPPKKFVRLNSGKLDWKDRTSNENWTEARKVLHLAQGVRNNLVHGSKFTAQESVEQNRNTKLIDAATTILAAFLNHSERVRDVFFCPAPNV
jgi:hypothetical protein